MSKRQLKRDIQREQEILNSKVSPDGSGEDPVVRAVLSDEFITMSESEALDIKLALQQLVRGQLAFLNRLDELSHEVNLLKQRAAEMDRDAKRWETDRENFIRECNEQADRVRAKTETERARIVAEGLNEYQQEVSIARVNAANKRLMLETKWANEPKVTVTSQGIVETVRDGSSFQQVVFPEILRIAHRTWVLEPNKPVELPQSVAEVYKYRKQQMELAKKRAEVLQIKGGNIRENKEVAAEWARINRESGVHTEPFPTYY